jgi:hypothetical protein
VVHRERFEDDDTLSKALEQMCKYMDERHIRSKDLFRLADGDGDGNLESKELLWLLKKVGVDADAELVKQFSEKACTITQHDCGPGEEGADEEEGKQRRESASSVGSYSSGYSTCSDDDDEARQKRKKKKRKTKKATKTKRVFQYDELENMIRLYRRGLLHHDMHANAATGDGGANPRTPSPPRTPTPEGLKFLGANDCAGKLQFVVEWSGVVWCVWSGVVWSGVWSGVVCVEWSVEWCVEWCGVCGVECGVVWCVWCGVECGVVLCGVECVCGVRGSA